jgi:uncharacterized protein YdhG (YjbR/CyaY superfamily)
MTDDQGALPPIGRPATRALASVGITRIEQLRQHRAEELLALHGVGPKAISRLRSALADHGLSFLADCPRQHLPDDVQEYIDALDAAHRPLFDRLHRLIVDELPDAQIVISYQIPLYRVGRRHLGLNARRPDGITLTTTSPDHIDSFRRRHPQFKTGKASIQFQLNDELPEDDMRDVIRRAINS